MKNLVTRLSMAVMIASLGVAIITLAAMAMGHKLVPVLSGSMRPNLSVGDAAVVAPVKPENLRVGDVIVARAGPGEQPLVIHRIVELNATESGVAARTKGDANGAPDAWVAEFGGNEVLRQYAVAPGVGYVVSGIAQLDTRVRLMQSTIFFLGVAGLVALWAPRRTSVTRTETAGVA